MIDTIVEKALPWLEPNGPEAEFVIYTSATLSRNLADLPFPARCSEEELRTAQDRVLSALEAEGYLERGQYFPIGDLSPADIRFLQERDLVQGGLFAQEGACGVFLSDDQSISIMINDSDHVVVRAHVAGLAPEAAARAAAEVDAALSQALDYTFDDKLGYLTSSTESVGTGLLVRAPIHTPGLTMTHALHDRGNDAEEDHHRLKAGPWTGSAALDQAQAAGDMIELVNTATLGRSEEEIVFHFNHKAASIIEAERQARTRILDEGRTGIEDRVGRALGIAQRARLIDEAEGRALLSALRLGVETKIDESVSLHALNRVFFTSRRGHLEMQVSENADALAISKQRADLFRASFS